MPTKVNVKWNEHSNVILQNIIVFISDPNQYSDILIFYQYSNFRISKRFKFNVIVFFYY